MYEKTNLIKAEEGEKAEYAIFTDGKLTGVTASLNPALEKISKCSQSGHVFDINKNMVVYFKKAEK
jgi:hypothetical protein